MEGLHREREQAQRAGVRVLGVSDRPRTYAGQWRATGREVEIMALPVSAAAAQPLQDEDGTPLFMWGLSAIGGPDPMG